MTSGTDRVDTPVAPDEPCPRCGAERPPDDRWCERCGTDLENPPGPYVEVRADEAAFARTPPTGLAFPAARPTVRLALPERGLMIGRSREGGPPPDVDLTGPLADPAASHHHARIEPDGSGGWGIRDCGSTNGTVVHGRPLDAESGLVPLADGDDIHVGAWTAIAVRLGPSRDDCR